MVLSNLQLYALDLMTCLLTQRQLSFCFFLLKIFSLFFFFSCFEVAEMNIYFAVDKIDDSERLRPEELNQQNIEALVAESNLV